MSMKAAHNSPAKAAHAAWKLVERRVGNGYWPFAYAHVSDLLMAKANYSLFISVKNRGKRKPSDLESYTFEIPCVSEEVANQAVAQLHARFLGIARKQEITIEGPRTGKMQPVKDIIKRHGKEERRK